MQHTRPDVYMLEHAQHLTSTHVFTLRPGRARGGLPTHLPAESSRAGPCQGVSRPRPLIIHATEAVRVAPDECMPRLAKDRSSSRREVALTDLRFLPRRLLPRQPLRPKSLLCRNGLRLLGARVLPYRIGVESIGAVNRRCPATGSSV
jgi:hypothetical protein